LPFGPVPTDYKEGFRFIVAPGIDISLLMMFAISSLSGYGVILGGWASNSKYSLYGAIRSCAQFISYEIPLGLSVIGIVAAAGSLNIEQIVSAQGDGIAYWNCWWQPLALLLFFTSALAESNRLPFDLAECEQELVGGFHTEYGGIKFVLFFLAEYTHVTTVSFLTVLLFLGGWHFPGIVGVGDNSWGANLLRLAILLVKVGGVIAFIMLLRWALPRFRFDQLMGLAWKGLIPLGLINLLAVAITLTFDLPRWPLAIVSILAFVIGGVISVNQLRRKIRDTSSSAATQAAAA
jgi:NADH-quinone oxidoreductase subunit H